MGVLTYGCCCIKTLSRHQQLVSLSSMESELHALQTCSTRDVSPPKGYWENFVYLSGSQGEGSTRGALLR